MQAVSGKLGELSLDLQRPLPVALRPRIELVDNVLFLVLSIAKARSNKYKVPVTVIEFTRKQCQPSERSYLDEVRVEVIENIILVLNRASNQLEDDDAHGKDFALLVKLPVPLIPGGPWGRNGKCCVHTCVYVPMHDGIRIRLQGQGCWTCIFVCIFMMHVLHCDAV